MIDKMTHLDGRAILAVFAICAAACGGDSGGEPFPVDSAGLDGNAGSCGTNGTGTVNGTVGGANVSPVISAFLVAVPDAGYALVLTEEPARCAIDSPGPGERLVLAFCDEVTAGPYTILTEQDFTWGTACPGQRIAGSLVEDTGTGADIEDGVSGTVTIDSTDGCIAGSFNATFTDDNTMAGSFSAVRCP